ncbi:Hypothetical protein FKW44_013292, partial [Caligus rogercresseyi]
VDQRFSPEDKVLLEERIQSSRIDMALLFTEFGTNVQTSTTKCRVVTEPKVVLI